MEVGPADIRAASERIGPRIRTTPVLRLEPGAFGVEGRLVLKLELLQHAGSFKARGAFNRMLSLDVPAEGVIAASGGNFGIAVAYAARALGHRAEIFVPATSSVTKIQRLGNLDATVEVVSGYYADALAACERRAAARRALFMHAYDQPEIVAGAGTLGLELSEQVPDADTVLVAVGGCGLIGGIASWFGGSVRVVGVEPLAAPTLHAALEAGRPVDVEVGGVAADSLGAHRAGRIGLSAAQRFVDRVVLVADGWIREAQRALRNEARLLAEPGAATPLAALRSGAYRPEPEETVVVLVCGANTDPATLSEPRTLGEPGTA